MQTQRNRWIRFLAISAMVLGLTGLVRAETHTWNGASGSDWFEATNWTPSGPPAAGDSVTYTNAGTALLLTNETPLLASFTMTGGTLTCTNWFTRIRAVDVAIESGTITLPPAFTEADMSNRVWIVASGDFTLGSNAVIDVIGKGYRAGQGPASIVSNDAWGGAHGGRGGRGQNFEGARALPFGNRKAPLTPGSGGKAGNESLGSGGGAVRIEATNKATVHGSIRADGHVGSFTMGHTSAGWNDGGGAGGAVYITCGHFAGDGLISVNGGRGGRWGTQDIRGGGGGGGRIALEYLSVAETSGVRFSAMAGASPSDFASGVLKKGEHRDAWMHSAGQGTLHLPDAGLLRESLNEARFTDVELSMEMTASWSPSSLQITNCRLTFAEEGFELAVADDLRIEAGGELGVRGRLTVGGDAILENGGVLCLVAAPTNALTPAYGSLLDVAGCLAIRDGGWLYPFSNPTNGGSVLLRMTDLKIASGGGIEASGKGFFDDHGDGSPASGWGGGAGHGGIGGQGQSGPGGSDYGVPLAPMKPGSGGRDGNPANIGGMGGGLVWVEAGGSITLNGAIVANGSMRATRYNGGGGSGGGIYLWSLGRFKGGESAVLRADGGEGGIWNTTDHRGGGGGGGRIAVWPGVSASMRERLPRGISTGAALSDTHPDFQGTISVTNGIGRCDDSDPSANPPLPGTVVFVIPPPMGALFILK